MMKLVGWQAEDTHAVRIYLMNVRFLEFTMKY